MNYVYNRQTPRAQWHHYNDGDYFVTICTKNREHYFGKVVNDTVQLTKIGEFLKLQIENTEKIRNGDVTIPIYVIMPNHVHLIIAVRTDAVRTDAVRTDAVCPDYEGGCKFGMQSKNLPSIIRGIKCSVTKYALQNNIPFGWQSRYNDHIIRNQTEMNNIAAYIENNPKMWYRDRNNPPTR